MIIKPNSDKIRYTGRWKKNEDEAFSTANGSYLEFAFSGENALIEFNTSYCRIPVPHVYIGVDNGALIEVPIERYIRISAGEGEHYVKVILKSSVESQHRWFAPIEAKVGIKGIEAEGFSELLPDNRKIIEFIGDSITEGISIDVGYTNYGGIFDMVFWDDSTAGYAWLTAKELDMRPVIMGYGSLGTTKKGSGNVPAVEESYPYYCDSEPMESVNADYIVINHGTNDCGADKEVFINAYYKFLISVRKRNTKSKIISLTPFSGALAEEINTAVKKYNEDFNDNVYYINSTGWIAPEPIHPLRDGHKTVSKKLSKIIKEEIM